jgi:hypothetical protein
MPYKDRNTQLEAQRQHYRDNLSTYRKRRKLKKIAQKEWFDKEIMLNLKCSICLESDPACLDFHHRDPSQKEGKVSEMVKGMRSKESILAEVAKCDVLCSNCHRKHHFYNCSRSSEAQSGDL